MGVGLATIDLSLHFMMQTLTLDPSGKCDCQATPNQSKHKYFCSSSVLGIWRANCSAARLASAATPACQQEQAQSKHRDTCMVNLSGCVNRFAERGLS